MRHGIRILLIYCSFTRHSVIKQTARHAVIRSILCKLSVPATIPAHTKDAERSIVRPCTVLISHNMRKCRRCETLKRVPPGLPTTLRADSGFYSKAVVERCATHGFTFTLTADQTAPLLETIGAVPERCWRPLPEYALSEVAAVRYQPTGWEQPYRYSFPN